MIAGAGELRGGARQPSGFNNSVRGGPAFTISLTHSRARGADDRGRRRATGWRATAIRFQQFGEGLNVELSLPIFRLALAVFIPWRGAAGFDRRAGWHPR